MTSCKWHGPYTGEVTGCCVHQAQRDRETTECTGNTAFWCPVHGDCTCERGYYGDCSFDDPSCPLHSVESEHAETPEPAENDQGFRVRLSEMVAAEGYGFTCGAWWVFSSKPLGSPQGHVALLSDLTIVCPADCWDYAYCASHEIAEHRHGFVHSPEMFAEQANILARWLRGVSGSNHG